MANLLIDNGIEKRKQHHKDIGISLLFFIATLLLPILTVGKLSFNREDNGLRFFERFGFKAYEAPSPIIFIPTIILWLIIYIILFKYRSKRKPINRFSVVILSCFIVYWFVSLFSFPFGSRSYVIQQVEGQKLVLTFQGFSIYARITEFVYDSLFAIYFLFTFNYAKNLPFFSKKLLVFILKLLIGLSVATILYSIAFEKEALHQSASLLFHKDFTAQTTPVVSFTTNKNVAGFFVRLGSISCILLFTKRVNFVYLIIYFISIPYLILIRSKTPLILLLLIGCLYGIFYPIFRWKKEKGYSIFFTILISVVILSALSLCIAKGEAIKKALNQLLFSGGTIGSRYILITTALDLFRGHERFFLTGMGQIPFTNLLCQYRDMLQLQDPVRYTSHNILRDDFLVGGLFSVLLVIALLIYLLVLTIRLFKKDKRWGRTTLILLVTTTIYSTREPRGLFYKEANSFFFVFTILLPILFLSGLDSIRKEILTKDLL